ncbi:tRNA pseudouridine(13) synthase TruD [Lysobacter sp. HDW10]|nr:tRNA pseudouridine(13) synthase TruD [Lysobacter sp. HDW10]
MPEVLPRSAAPVITQASIRNELDDFIVEEVSSFDAFGSGEHLLLTLRKRGLSTHALIEHVATWAGVPTSAIGYAGLKDKHAVTTQRLTVWLPKRKSPDIATLNTDAIEVIEAVWHNRKLSTGALKGNRFTLVLRDVAGDPEAIRARVSDIAQHGVPNYYGEQRFGRFGDNVAQARDMFAGKRVARETRSLLLSAARSDMFNQVLAQRVEAGTWRAALAGDVFMLDGSQSIFGPVEDDESIHARLESGDIHPTGPLWGRGDLRTQADAQSLETEVLMSTDNDALRTGLEAAGMKQERRSLRLRVRDLHATQEGTTLTLQFALDPGSYATTVLHALGEVIDPMRKA